MSEKLLTDETEYWTHLSRRVSAELRASRDNNVRFLWMDGVVPGTLSLQLEREEIHALAFISEDSIKTFVHYRVTLHLGAAAMEALARGEWTRLLPPADTTGWLRVDRARKEIDVTCAADGINATS